MYIVTLNQAQFADLIILSSSPKGSIVENDNLVLDWWGKLLNKEIDEIMWLGNKTFMLKEC
jgi:hypothetical protein